MTPQDGANPSVAYLAQGLPAGAVFDAESITFTWMPTFAQAGDYVVRFVATDDGDGTGTSLSASIDVPIRIRNANRAPVEQVINNFSVDRGDVVDLALSFPDPDGNPVVLSATGLPRFATLNGNADGTGLLHIAPGADDRGDYVVTVTATDDGDGGGPKAKLSTSRQFVISANSPAEAPRLQFIGNKVAVVDQKLEFLVRAADLDQDALTFSAESLPSGATFLNAVRLEPRASSGRLGLQIAGRTRSPSRCATTVTQAREHLSRTARRSTSSCARRMRRRYCYRSVIHVAEGALLQVQLTVIDTDGDPVTFSAANLPPGATLDALTGVLRYSPNLLAEGVYSNVTLTASDGHASSTETIRIGVTRTNQAPILVSIPPLGGQEDRLLDFFLVASDFDSDAIFYRAISALPQGAHFDGSNGHFEWKPTFAQAGEYVFRFEASDAAGAKDNLDVEVRIDDVNRAPVVSLTNHRVLLGEQLSFTIGGSDPDSNETLAFSAEGLPEGASLHAQTGAFAWTPGSGQVGDHLVMVNLSDSKATTIKPLVISASVEPVAPVVAIELTPSFPAVPGQSVTVTVLADSFRQSQPARSR